MHRGVRVICAQLAVLVVGCCPQFAQNSERIKVAEGEYRVTTEDDIGEGPIETEVFPFPRVLDSLASRERV
jgi:hypothetical protein